MYEFELRTMPKCWVIFKICQKVRLKEPMSVKRSLKAEGAAISRNFKDLPKKRPLEPRPKEKKFPKGPIVQWISKEVPFAK